MVHTADNTHHRLSGLWNAARADEGAEVSLNTLPTRTEAEVRIGGMPYGPFYTRQMTELALLAVLCFVLSRLPNKRFMLPVYQGTFVSVKWLEIFRDLLYHVSQELFISLLIHTAPLLLPNWPGT